MTFDLRDLRPSEAKGLTDFLQVPENKQSFVAALVAYLVGLNPSSESDADQAVALSHELGASGVWENLDWTLLERSLSPVNRAAKIMFFATAPLELEQLLLGHSGAVSKTTEYQKPTRVVSTGGVGRIRAASGGYAVSPRMPFGAVKKVVEAKPIRYHKGLRRKALSADEVSFMVEFVSQRVKETISVRGGTQLKRAELGKLCEILHEKSRMYVVGLRWSATVRRDANQEFTVEELVRSDATLLLRSSTKFFQGSEVSITFDDIVRSGWIGSKATSGKGGITASIEDGSRSGRNTEQNRKKK